MYVPVILLHHLQRNFWWTRVLVVITYTKKFGLHFGKGLPTEREFGNFVDCYTVVVKKDSSNYAFSEFENSFWK